MFEAQPSKGISSNPDLAHTDRVQKERLELVREQLSVRPLPKHTATPLVSIIILNYNGKDVLPRCLRALSAQSYKHFEVLVIDNHSTDGSDQIAQNFIAPFPLTVIRADTNLGVAGGRNVGVTKSRGEVLAFLDNDGYPTPEWLQEALNALYSETDIGAVCSLVFFADDPLRVNGFGGVLTTSGLAADRDYGVDITNLKPRTTVFYPMGCGMVLRAESAHKVFPLDALLPKWYDDTEIGIRLHLYNQQVIVAPLAIVDHDAHSGDKKRMPAGWKRALLFEKARMRTVLKYFPLSKLPRWMAQEVAQLLRITFSKEVRKAPVLCVAFIWNLFHLGSIVRLRQLQPPCNFWKHLVSPQTLERGT